jgi:hypothetical protein
VTISSVTVVLLPAWRFTDVTPTFERAQSR